MEDQTERMYEFMRKESNRLKTFQMNPPWPKDYVDIKKLAKAGFFYAFNGDNVYCAFCRGQVCRWDRNDDPMSEHARHFTTCPFIMGGEVGNEPLGEDPFPGPKRPRPYDVCGVFPNSPPQDDTRSSQNQYQVERANHGQYYNNLEQFNHSYGEELNLSGVSEVNEEPLVHDDNHHHQNLNHTPVYDSSSDCQSNRHSPNSLNSNCSNSSGSLNGICKICYTNSIELVFLPCGHSVSCLSCAHRLHNCPCCRASITTRIRTFLV